MKGKISEVFDSVQGEGLYLGEKQLFVRFFGCNLWCRFCDTKQDTYMEYEPQELLEELRLYGNGHHSISFTGGEPLLQKNFLKEILKLTRAQGYRHYLETNGTLVAELEDIIDYLDIIAMDLKLPSSTDMVCVWGMHRRFLKVASQKEVFIKSIICESTTESDLKEAIGIIREINNSALFILQPNSHERHNKTLQEKLQRFKDLCFKEKVTACIIEQIHKVIGVK